MSGLGSSVAEGLFWCCASVLFYVYFGYPALIGSYALFRSRATIFRDDWPHASIVVVAHNEGARIEHRISNLLALDYPAERLEILLASDGSTDDTVARARGYASDRLRVMEFESRRGKAAVLNAVIPQARADIVVLADARQRFAPGVLRALLRHFSDPEVGAVSGELVLESDPHVSGVGEGVGFYWRYEKFIRVTESRIDSTVGATGAIYAIRKSLFETIAEDTLLDDVLIPMQIARRGYRVLFEREALAYDRAASSASVELTRKVRTIAGNFQLFASHPWLLNPFQNRLWFQTWSHKLLRLLSPLALLGAFSVNLLLLDKAPYRWSLELQAAFYAAALGGFGRRNSARTPTLLSVPYAFCLLNWATVLAFVRFASGQQAVTWERGPGVWLP
jgi:cellulose synthase/poly-beta-1,6-N-acetylglucosamine synthase-like glycosyltransferase